MMRRTALKPCRDRPRRKGPPAPRIRPRREEDPKHLAAVRALGCIICGALPAEAHHVRDGAGMGQKASDLEAIPLCAFHHRTGPPGQAFHGGPRLWEQVHGPQRDHLARTLAQLSMIHEPSSRRREKGLNP